MPQIDYQVDSLPSSNKKLSSQPHDPLEKANEEWFCESQDKSEK